VNNYIFAFVKTYDGHFDWVLKLYRADYESDATENAKRDLDKNFPGWGLLYLPIAHYDEFSSAQICKFSK
jgi:hypothetical protein